MSGIRLDFTRIPFRFEYERRNMSLEFKSQAPQIEIESTPPQLQIDQTLPREEAGFRTMLSFARYYAEQGQQDALAAIEKIAADGDRMAMIDLPQNGVKALAEEELYREPLQSEGVAIPQNLEISAVVTPLSFNYSPGTFDFDFQPAVFNYRFEYSKNSGRLVPAGSSLDKAV